MSWLVQSRLINGPFDDPGLYVDFRFGRRALLFDLGDLGALSSRELLRVTHALVSHTHMDHFAGFDRLLRLALHRPAPLRLIGPPGFVDRVEHKLRAYTWNLLDESSMDFSISVAEFAGDRLGPAAEFRAREAFRRRETETPALPPGVVLEDESFRIECITLDHGTPCLAFALRETRRINVLKEGLAELGLPVGPWLNEAKRAVRQERPDDTPIQVASGRSVGLGTLKAHALSTAPGQVLAYVVDAAYTDANIAGIAALARDADQLYIETAFLDEDAALAAEKRHLTAAQAGRIARFAGVRRFVPLHFSTRYIGREEALRREAEAAFAGQEP
jgi:ribonuclease Z